MAFSSGRLSLPLLANTAVNQSSDDSILRNSHLKLRRIPTTFTERSCSRVPRAIQSQKYVYPNPIPEFAEAETHKFKAELLKKLLNEEATYGKDLHRVASVCSEIFPEFLHQEYGGPGTLLIEPFTDMMVALKENNLPGAEIAARASLLWAQKYVDKDWETWNSIK